MLEHLKARDVTMMCVSQAPVEKLEAERARLGWSFTWASSHDSDFNSDFEHSRTREEASAWVPNAPSIVWQNASDCGTDPAGYMAQRPGLSVFALEDGEVYLTYASTARGLEMVMTYWHPRPGAGWTRRGRPGLPHVDPPPRRVRGSVTR